MYDIALQKAMAKKAATNLEHSDLKKKDGDDKTKTNGNTGNKNTPSQNNVTEKREKPSFKRTIQVSYRSSSLIVNILCFSYQLS